MPKETPWSSTKWGVHVLGPDNVLAAHDFDQAVKKCNEINSSLVEFSRLDICNEDMPMVFAQVARWCDISTSEHDPYITDWDNACA